ncbi:hypothetical protein SAMN05216598_4972 [Pseudomonas asplenii]|uniref:Uncharacterized protein n=1 Tax=Pseudomonas asplenii TaxID=53407 RepID=A0A1H1ZBP6_9PSED|nr:hypothetical protein [Pseudomonas asplenii]UZE31334.1 hypothetical protein LOY63_11640 [Pseudomonas asplenii]SDT31090.1 hypothetical protein SAMN05216598_4972 [Pseudomonas asplenii]
MFLNIDSRLSRDLLKCINSGIPHDALNVPKEPEFLSEKIEALRDQYTALRKSFGNRTLPVSNYLFYMMLKDKYSEFDFELPLNSKARVLTNIHVFKTKGRIPSIASLLLSDEHAAKSAVELKYTNVEQIERYGPALSQLLTDGGLMLPTQTSMEGVIAQINSSKRLARRLTIVSAICPDYSYVMDAEGKPRYTFTHVGAKPGLAGEKLLKVDNALSDFSNAVGISLEHKLFGGEFEYISFNRNANSESARGEFLDKVYRQLLSIGNQLTAPAVIGSFFELCGDEDGWHKRHQAILQRLHSGDYGQTGLCHQQMEEIFESRRPLYSKWFVGQSDETIWNNFLSQAAEYALMGGIFLESYKDFVVLAVDHYKMEPFYSFFGPVAVLYVKTDYL